MSDRSRQFGESVAHGELHDLYRSYGGWLTARLRQRFGDDSDDLAQEAWMRIAPYARAGRVQHPKALLLRIVDNLVVDRFRKSGPHPVSHVDHAVAAPVAEAAPQIDALLLKQVILNMPPNLRDVFVLSRFAHLEYQEIGERLNLPVTTVQWRMGRALEYCAAQLRL